MYDHIHKFRTGHRSDYTTGCLLDYFYFRKHKIIKIDLRIQQELYPDPKAFQKFTVLKI